MIEIVILNVYEADVITILFIDLTQMRFLYTGRYASFYQP